MSATHDVQCGTELVACLIVTEISSPLLHLREMLKEVGIRDTDLNLLADVRAPLSLSLLFEVNSQLHLIFTMP